MKLLIGIKMAAVKGLITPPWAVLNDTTPDDVAVVERRWSR